MNTALVPIKPRVAMPANAGIDPNVWPVLTNALFPNARSAESIVLAVSYCKARNLDIMKKPVNIVPVWDSRANNGDGGYVEQIWPSINETQVTAARSGEWAGLDAPKFGQDVTHTFKGRQRISGKWENAEVTVTFPESCEVTVYRLKGGVPRAFTEPVWWREAYGRVGGSDLPNAMWTKRPRGQLLKVAKATSLRAAFPEEGGYDEDEIAGTSIPVAPEAEPPKPKDNWQPPQTSQAGDQRGDREDDQGGSRQPEPPPHDETPPQSSGDERPQATAGPPAEYVDSVTGQTGPQAIPVLEKEPWADWGLRYLNAVKTARNADEVNAWAEKNESSLNSMKEHADKVHARLTAAIGKHLLTIPATAPDRLSGGPTIIGAG